METVMQMNTEKLHIFTEAIIQMNTGIRILMEIVFESKNWDNAHLGHFIM
jgi:hypothetical protein